MKAIITFLPGVLKLNIAFDMSFAKEEIMNRGIGRYSKNLIQHIIMLNDSHNFFYFYPDYTKEDAYLKDELQRFITVNKIDVFHILSPYYPLENHRILHREWFGTIKVVATIYDLIPMLYPNYYLSNPAMQAIYNQVTNFIRSCNLLYAISETTKTDVVRLLEIDPNKIKVIMGGIDEQFKIDPIVNRSYFAIKYGISKPYIMNIGGADFRKNLNGLVEGFAKAKAALNNSIQLVIVYSDKQQILSSGMVASVFNDVIFTGYVSDEDLVKLYNGAEIVAFPSFYEGLGFPVIEAMACGTPVLTSKTSSLSEVSGDAAYLVDPYNIDEISKGLIYLMENAELRVLLREKGLVQSAKFQWEHVAQYALEGYAKVNQK